MKTLRALLLSICATLALQAQVVDDSGYFINNYHQVMQQNAISIYNNFTPQNQSSLNEQDFYLPFDVIIDSIACPEECPNEDSRMRWRFGVYNLYVEYAKGRFRDGVIQTAISLGTPIGMTAKFADSWAQINQEIVAATMSFQQAIQSAYAAYQLTILRNENPDISWEAYKAALDKAHGDYIKKIDGIFAKYGIPYIPFAFPGGGSFFASGGDYYWDILFAAFDRARIALSR